MSGPVDTTSHQAKARSEGQKLPASAVDATRPLFIRQDGSTVCAPWPRLYAVAFRDVLTSRRYTSCLRIEAVDVGFVEQALRTLLVAGDDEQLERSELALQDLIAALREGRPERS